MILILEGPDGAGKSTLAKEWETAGYTVIHHGPPEPREDLFTTYLNALLLAPPNCVFDRLFHGEAVYGPLMRGKSRLTLGELTYLELVAAARGAVLVRCRAYPEDLKARGDPIYSRVAPERLLSAYATVYSTSRMLHVEYNSSVDKTSDATGRVAWVARRDLVTQRGVGRCDAQVALVGDRFNNKMLRPPRGAVEWGKPPYSLRRPFCDATSRDWLMLALLECPEFRPEDIYLTNAYKDQLTETWSRVAIRGELGGFPKVIALGHEAAEELLAANVPVHGQLPHPQFFKRFHHRELRAYAKQLRSTVWPS